MKYVLTTPRTVGGDLDSGNPPVVVEELELASIAFVVTPDLFAAGKITVSVVLIHPPSGLTRNIVYARDAGAFSFWRDVVNLNGRMETAIFQRLAADNKIPPGTITP